MATFGGTAKSHALTSRSIFPVAYPNSTKNLHAEGTADPLRLAQFCCVACPDRLFDQSCGGAVSSQLVEKSPVAVILNPAEVWRVKNLLLFNAAAKCRFFGRPGIVHWKIPVLRMTPGNSFSTDFQQTHSGT
jgi:hypothetical protein